MGLRRAYRMSAAAFLVLLAATPALANPDVEAARGESYALLGIPLLLFAIIAIEVLVFRLTLRPPHLWRTVAAANALSAVIAIVAMIMAPSREAKVMAYGVGYLMEVAVLVVAWQALGPARVLVVVIGANVLSTIAFFFVLLPGWAAVADFASRPRVALMAAPRRVHAVQAAAMPAVPRLLDSSAVSLRHCRASAAFVWPGRQPPLAAHGTSGRQSYPTRRRAVMALDQIRDMLRGVAETAKVETVFGESREIAGRTIIPVARVMYGGGGGGGQGQRGEGATGTGTGGGGGMGVRVQPLGIFVVTDNAERFVATLDLTRVILAGSAVALATILTVRKVLLNKQRARWMSHKMMMHRKGWREEKERAAA